MCSPLPVVWLQNEMDDWEENEELRAIEGLEGKCDITAFVVVVSVWYSL